jgi:hypothetical protein
MATRYSSCATFALQARKPVLDGDVFIEQRLRPAAHCACPVHARVHAPLRKHHRRAALGIFVASNLHDEAQRFRVALAQRLRGFRLVKQYGLGRGVEEFFLVFGAEQLFIHLGVLAVGRSLHPMVEQKRKLIQTLPEPCSVSTTIVCSCEHGSHPAAATPDTSTSQYRFANPRPP